MRIAKIISLLCLLSMSGILVYAFAAGSFSQDGARLLVMPWGIVSLVDLYTGFILFSGWIIFRERSLWSAVVWVVMMMVLGFWTGSLYTLIALQKSRGSWRHFWLGKRAEGTNL